MTMCVYTDVQVHSESHLTGAQVLKPLSELGLADSSKL